MTNEPKEAVIHVRVSNRVASLIKFAAEAAGVSVSAYLREAAEKAARAELNGGQS